jgi:hypothetical protein
LWKFRVSLITWNRLGFQTSPSAVNRPELIDWLAFVLSQISKTRSGAPMVLRQLSPQDMGRPPAGKAHVYFLAVCGTAEAEPLSKHKRTSVRRSISGHLCGGHHQVSDRVISYLTLSIPGPRIGTWGTQCWYVFKRSDELESRVSGPLVTAAFAGTRTPRNQ